MAPLLSSVIKRGGLIRFRDVHYRLPLQEMFHPVYLSKDWELNIVMESGSIAVSNPIHIVN